jgi:hypothetical protein
MAFTNITPPNVGDPTKKQSFAKAVIDNLAYLYNVVLRILSQDGFENGSFETDIDGDGVPDGWTRSLTGGTIVLDTTAANVTHGLKSAKFSSTGSGGGYLQYTDFFEVARLRPFVLSWQMKSTVATVTNKVEVLFYDSAQSFLSTSTIYNDALTNPTVWTVNAFPVSPPANAKFAKIKITGADSTTVGSTWFDDFRILPPISNVPIGKNVYTSGTTTFTVPENIFRVRVILVGGGGGGGAGATTSPGGNGGNGGKGAFVEAFVSVVPGSAITVTVGAAGTAGVYPSGAGGNGGNSVFGTVIAGGGHGGTLGAAGAAGAVTCAFPNTTTATSNFFLAKGTAGGGAAGGTGTNGTAGVIGYAVVEW